MDAESNLKNFDIKLNGDALRSRYEGEAPTSIREKVNVITEALWSTTSEPTETFLRAYENVSSQFEDLLHLLKNSDYDIKVIEEKLEKHGAPITPGRFPVWKKLN